MPSPSHRGHTKRIDTCPCWNLSCLSKSITTLPLPMLRLVRRHDDDQPIRVDPALVKLAVDEFVQRFRDGLRQWRGPYEAPASPRGRGRVAGNLDLKFL